MSPVRVRYVPPFLPSFTMSFTMPFKYAVLSQHQRDTLSNYWSSMLGYPDEYVAALMRDYTDNPADYYVAASTIYLEYHNHADRLSEGHEDIRLY